MTWLLVGLGNPGTRYARNRHNIGFILADALARHYHFGSWRQKFHGQLSEGSVGPHRVSLLKPETFMNHSGRSVQAAAQFLKLPPERILVLHDELDLPPGKIRVKRGGGHGGNNGVRDIDACIGNDFWRLRVGIGHPGIKELVSHHVLQDFTAPERDVMNEAAALILENLPTLLAGDAARFANDIALQQQSKERTAPKTAPQE